MKTLEQILRDHDPVLADALLVPPSPRGLWGPGARLTEHLKGLPHTGRWSGSLTSAATGAGFRAVLPSPALGETATIHPLPNGSNHHNNLPDLAAGGILAEITGFKDHLTTITPLENPNPHSRLGPGCLVTPSGAPLTIWAGPALKGRVLDPIGRPIDQKGALPTTLLTPVPLTSLPTPPLLRHRSQTRFKTRIRAIDSLTPLLTGQRIALAAPAGTGKTTLLTSIAAHAALAANTGTSAHEGPTSTILCLVGERGREAADLINNRLTARTRSNITVFLSCSHDPPLARIKCAEAATAAAQALSDRGESVLLLMDSLTRYARALRDVAITSGESQGRRGYPPSMASSLARLLERAGPGTKGSITGIYTLLVEDREDDDPLAEEVKSLVDAHLVLDRRLAAEGIFPPLHPIRSISRIPPECLEPKHQEAIHLFKKMWATLDQYRDLVAAGAWQPGNNPELDQAVEMAPLMERFISDRSPAPEAGGLSSEEALINLMFKHPGSQPLTATKP